MLTLAGVIGHPVAHSRSPAMHNAAFEALGLDWRYLRLPVPPALFEETVRALPRSGYRGVNVTIPHKEAALAVADHASEAARAIGAANTLTFAGGAIHADNTDAGGLLAALPRDPRGSTALVLGAGGAGRAAAWALREAGARVGIWNRTPERARAVAEALGVGHVKAEGVERAETRAVEHVKAGGVERPETRPHTRMAVDIVVNATSVGLRPDDAIDDLPLGWIDPPSIAVELVYGEGRTPFQAWAEDAGAELVDALEVLARQGALSFEAWTGRKAPLELMRQAARATSHP